jgi:hypothetical protein
MERETGIEPATSSLGSWHSTAELLPLSRPQSPEQYHSRARAQTCSRAAGSSEQLYSSRPTHRCHSRCSVRFVPFHCPTGQLCALVNRDQQRGPSLPPGVESIWHCTGRRLTSLEVVESSPRWYGCDNYRSPVFFPSGPSTSGLGARIITPSSGRLRQPQLLAAEGG